jgi:hypothetical protein
VSRIRMAVRIENLTQEPLRLLRSQLEHGDWTNPWQPPPRVDPGATVEFRAEGNMVLGTPTTGTEGRVTYAIGDDDSRHLYAHFNSPLVESQYGNTFHIWCPTEYDVHSIGGQGHHASLKITLQPTRKHRVPGFIPSVCGLHFRNKWSGDLPVVSVGTLFNKLRDQLPKEVADSLGIVPIDPGFLPFTHADAGLCGGMVYTVMDYHAAKQLPPTTAAAPTDSADVLFHHIRDRLIDSFDIAGRGSRYLAYSAPTYPNGDEGLAQAVGLWLGRSWVTYRQEWPKIRDDIDAGRLSPLALIQTDELDIGKNHQVLAYAYQRSGQQVEIWIYDPNEPDANNVRLQFDLTDTAGEVRIDRLGGDPTKKSKRIWCIFRTDGYTPQAAPGGRPAEAMTLREALERTTENRSGRVPTDVPGLSRPISARAWMRTI